MVTFLVRFIEVMCVMYFGAWQTYAYHVMSTKGILWDWVFVICLGYGLIIFYIWYFYSEE